MVRVQEDKTAWDFAVLDISAALLRGDKEEANRRARMWERNAGFDGGKLYEAATEETKKGH